MKAFIILVVCLVAASADVSTDDEKTFKQCLKDHNIDPDNMSESKEAPDSGCFDYCFYKAYKFMKSDGTLDFDQLLEGGENDPEAQWVRKVYETAEEACRAGAGDNNCRFFQCMHKFDPKKLKVNES